MSNASIALALRRMAKSAGGGLADGGRRPLWNAGAMALRRALEMLKAGERINDELYRSTVHGLRRSAVALWVYEPGRVPIPVQPARGSTAQPRVV